MMNFEPGDVVFRYDADARRIGIVTYYDAEYNVLTVMRTDGDCGFYDPVYVNKTGMKIPEFMDILQKLKETGEKNGCAV